MTDKTQVTEENNEVTEKVSTENKQEETREETIDYKALAAEEEAKYKDLRKNKEEKYDEEHYRKKYENLKIRNEKFLNESVIKKTDKEESLSLDESIDLKNGLVKLGFDGRLDSEEAKKVIKLAKSEGIEKISEALGDPVITAALNKIRNTRSAESLMKTQEEDGYIIDRLELLRMKEQRDDFLSDEEYIELARLEDQES